MSGFSDLGAALGGLDQSQSNAYQTGMLRGAQGADLLEQARQRRNKNLAMAAITPDKIASAQADPAGQGASDLAAALVQGGVNPSEVSNYIRSMQGTGMRGQAWQAATQPGASVASLNPMLAVIDGKPVAVSGVEGNTLINKYVDPSQQAAAGGNVPTAVGQSDITAALARAGASNASAARSYAGIGADKAGNYDLVTDGSGNMVRVNKLTGQPTPITMADGTPLTAKKGASGTSAGKVPPSVYEAVLGKALPTGKPNPMQLQFQNYMALHPDMTDEEGLRSFARASMNDPANNANPIPLTPEQITAGKAGISLTTTPSSLGEAIGAPSPQVIPPEPASMAEALNSANTAKPIPGQVNASGDYTPPATPPAKTVIRTGKQNGRKVVQYSDGTIDYAD